MRTVFIFISSFLLACTSSTAWGKAILSSGATSVEEVEVVTSAPSSSLQASPNPSSVAERRKSVPTADAEKASSTNIAFESNNRPTDARPRLLFSNPLSALLMPFGGLFSQPTENYQFHQPSYYREEPTSEDVASNVRHPESRPYPVRARPQPQPATAATSGNFFTNGFQLVNDALGQMHPDPRVSEGARLRMFDRISNGFRTVENFLARPGGGNPRQQLAGIYEQFHRQQPLNRPPGLFDFLLEPFFGVMRTFFPWLPIASSQTATSSQGSQHPFGIGLRPMEVEDEDEEEEDEPEQNVKEVPKTGFLLNSQHLASNGPSSQSVQNVLDEVPPRDNEINDVRRNVNRVRPNWVSSDSGKRQANRRVPSGSIRDQFPPAGNRRSY